MNPWVEKIMFALLPLLLSGVIYLFSTVVTLQSDVQLLQSEAALARQQLKEEVLDEVLGNRTQIEVLKEQVKQLQIQNSDK